MQQIQSQLHTLRLSGMAESLQQQREQPNTYVELSFEERLSHLVSAEATYRDNIIGLGNLQKSTLARH